MHGLEAGWYLRIQTGAIGVGAFKGKNQILAALKSGEAFTRDWFVL